MAIRVRAQLRKWFGRGMYPTAEQFSDLFDSFFHKTEDKIPMSGVEGLTDQLNGKYNTAEGRELEKKVQKVTDDLSVHVASSEKAFNEVQNDIEALDGRLDTEIERAKGEEAAIRRELAAGDAATLSSAKSYTDTSVAAEAEERTQGDAATLSSAKTYTDTAVADEAQKRGQGDAATLRAANEHTDAAVAEEASARESGDRATLQSAKDYVDKAIAELVDGSPAALDTLKELSAALGNDPNFATTVATQIGRKVDKVAGQGPFHRGLHLRGEGQAGGNLIGGEQLPAPGLPSGFDDRAGRHAPLHNRYGAIDLERQGIDGRRHPVSKRSDVVGRQEETRRPDGRRGDYPMFNPRNELTLWQQK